VDDDEAARNKWNALNAENAHGGYNRVLDIGGLDEISCDMRAQFVTMTLIRSIMIVSMNAVINNAAIRARFTLAIDCIGRGFPIWRPHVHDILDLIRRLHKASLMVQFKNLSAAATKALLQAGRVCPRHFVNVMGKEAMSSKNSDKDRSSALLAVITLVTKYPAALVNVLPTTVQIITRCLDPSEPALRKSLLEASTKALHLLVQKYPMVAFHQTSQRFAVGTGPSQQNVIVIYDLSTATKWRILEGHKGSISAVSFNATGDVLMSYSADENPPSLRVWNTAVSGFFSSLMGVEGRCTKVIKLSSLNLATPRSIQEQIQCVRIIWNTAGTAVQLIREDERKSNFNV
jgi:hypothetical protein